MAFQMEPKISDNSFDCNAIIFWRFWAQTGFNLPCLLSEPFKHQYHTRILNFYTLFHTGSQQKKNPPFAWRRWCMRFECKSPVRSILGCYSDALGTLTHRTTAVCKNFTWLTTHGGSFQSSPDPGTCSNCFTDCYPLNFGRLLIHQDPSSKPPRRKMPWDLHLTGFTGGLCLSLGQFPFL